MDVFKIVDGRVVAFVKNKGLGNCCFFTVDLNNFA